MSEKAGLDGVNYIDVRKEDGEVIASIPLTEGDDEIIMKNDYVVVFGYGKALYEDRDGKIYAVSDNEEEVPKV